MAKKKFWQRNSSDQASGQTAAPESEKPPSELETPVSGVPSREQQSAESAKAASSAPKATPGENPAHVLSASGAAETRVAPSAPGSLITTSEGTFTRDEWEERQRASKVAESD